MGKNVEVREKVGHCVSDKILSPAHKRFNSSSPLITLSDPAVAVEASTCVCVCVCVRYTVCIEKMRETEGERSVQGSFTILRATSRPMEFLPHKRFNRCLQVHLCVCMCICVCEKQTSERERQREKSSS